MNIMITGGSGFIGTHLARILESAGHNVLIYDKVAPEDTTISFIVADVRNLAALSESAIGKDVIFNLAAEHRDDVRPLILYDEVNVGGARNVVTAAVSCGVKTIIFTSSVAVYGESDGPLDELSAHNYINDYGRTKSEAEIEHIKWAESDPTHRLVVVRPSVVFGPGNRGNVYNLLRQIASGKFLMVGNGKNRKSMAFVGNVAAFIASTIDHPPGVRFYNYADKPDFDMNTLVALIRQTTGKGSDVGPRLPVGLARLAGALADIVASVTGRSLPISSVRVQKFIANTEVDSGRAMESGFVPPFDLREGLAQTIQTEFVAKAA